MPKVNSSVSSLMTPAFLVHYDQMQRNIARLQGIAKNLSVELRPHVKTHKVPEFGILQTSHQNSNERSIIVSTLAEASYFARSGFGDILYASPVAPSKLSSVQLLMDMIPRFHFFVDSHDTLDAIEKFGKNKGMDAPNARKFSVFIKVDCGYHRAGIPYNDEGALSLAERIDRGPVTTFVGVYSHSGHSYNEHSVVGVQEVAETECARLVEFATSLRVKGIHVNVVSVGATPQAMLATNLSGVTEIHAGNYVFFDRQQVDCCSCSESEIACSVVTTIIGHYKERNTMLIDAGALALSKDTANDGCYGSIVNSPELLLIKISQECGVITSDMPIDYDSYPIGSLLFILPNHSCLTAACHSLYYAVKEDATSVCGVSKIVSIHQPVRGWDI